MKWLLSLLIVVGLSSSWIVYRSIDPHVKAIQIEFDDINHEEGFCYLYQLPDFGFLKPRSDATGHLARSELELLENGVLLKSPHALHSRIRTIGEGKFSHWNDTLRFATSDNTDPRKNDRSYIAMVPLYYPRSIIVAVWIVGVCSSSLFIVGFWWALGFTGRHVGIVLSTSFILLTTAATLVTATSRADLWRAQSDLDDLRIQDMPFEGEIYQMRQVARPFWTPVPREEDGRVLAIVRRDGKPLRLRPSTKEEVRTEGNGRFAFDEYFLFFAPPDADLSPGTGRPQYSIDCPVRAPWWLVGVSACAFVLSIVARRSIIRFWDGSMSWQRRFRMVAVSAAIPGALLLGLNIFGEFQTLRNDEIYEEFPGYDDIVHSLGEAREAMNRRPDETDHEFAERLNIAVHDGMLHRWHLPDVERFHIRIPAWENFILYAGAQFNTYCSMYHFVDPFKALERGVGMCGQQSACLVGYLRHGGVNAEVVQLKGHTVVTAEVAPGEWHVLDPDLGAYVPHPLEHIEQSPRIIEQHYRPALTHPFFTPALKDAWIERLVSWYGPEGNHTSDVFGREFERRAYILKWAIPAVLLVPLLFSLVYGRRRRPPAHEHAQA